MGLVIPPAPLPKEVIEERIRNGAKTLEEIDPAFWKWHQERQRQHLFAFCLLGFGVLILMFMALIIMLRA